MEPWEVAVRQFQVILPRSDLDYSDVPFDQLKVWLRDDVSSAVEELQRRPLFRDFATWSMRELTAGAKSEERRLIERLDQGLVAAVQAILHLFPPPKSADSGTNAQSELTVKWELLEEIDIGGGKPTSRQVVGQLSSSFAVEASQVRKIAQRFWTDLVFREDYFYPVREWGMARRGQAQPAEFIPFLNPTLHEIGDFVGRTLLQRIDVLFDSLQRYRVRSRKSSSDDSASAAVAAERSAWGDLIASRKALEVLLFGSPKTTVRDACVILTQAYSAFARSPDISWLELPEPVLEGGVARIRQLLTSWQHGEFVNRIAGSLGQVPRLYGAMPSHQSAHEAAIASEGLVLIVPSREAYWEAKKIADAQLQRPQMWKLLLLLAEKSRLGGALQERDLFEGGEVSRFPNAICRLRAILPASLKKRIKNIRGERAYRLDLESRKIFIVKQF